MQIVYRNLYKDFYYAYIYLNIKIINKSTDI